MPRLYGFEDAAHRRVLEAEAAGIRQAMSRRLAKQLSPQVVEWMNAAGYRTTLGNLWRPVGLDAVLDHPAIAGLEEDDQGELVETGGPQIVTPAEFKQLRAQKEAAKPASPRAEQRDYLLTSGGLSVCGLCGSLFTASPSNSGSRGYRCAPSTAQHPGGCGKVRINADLAEIYVAENVLAELAKPEVARHLEAVHDRVLAESAELRKRAKGDRARQSELGKEYASTQMSGAAFRSADRELSKRIREAEVEARRLEQVKQAPLGGVRDLVHWWKHAPLASKKGVLVLMLEQIAFYPAASRGSRTVDSNRVALTWRTWATAPGAADAERTEA
ncbi:recombinase zinc beta ribbon domain-containing protein [Streptomyces sp. NPDC057654]|uniref:recombinase zinc beta ribbon domain-containing protein n=1 Tax=Streptomyces sp. NPDC057654 TaxID=3346196 RepID=UPI0036B01568